MRWDLSGNGFSQKGSDGSWEHRWCGPRGGLLESCSTNSFHTKRIISLDRWMTSPAKCDRVSHFNKSGKLCPFRVNGIEKAFIEERSDNKFIFHVNLFFCHKFQLQSCKPTRVTPSPPNLESWNGRPGNPVRGRAANLIPLIRKLSLQPCENKLTET